MDPIVLGPGEGEAVTLAGNDAVLKAETKDTGGHLGLVDYTAAPGFPGPPPHIHDEMTDMFFVLEGTLTMQLGEQTIEAERGSFILVPPKTAHTFSNPGAEPVRFLSLVAPGGFEQYFKQLAEELGDGPFDPEVAGRVSAAYDIEAAG